MHWQTHTQSIDEDPRLVWWWLCVEYSCYIFLFPRMCWISCFPFLIVFLLPLPFLPVTFLLSVFSITRFPPWFESLNNKMNALVFSVFGVYFEPHIYIYIYIHIYILVYYTYTYTYIYVHTYTLGPGPGPRKSWPGLPGHDFRQPGSPGHNFRGRGRALRYMYV